MMSPRAFGLGRGCVLDGGERKTGIFPPPPSLFNRGPEVQCSLNRIRPQTLLAYHLQEHVALMLN